MGSTEFAIQSLSTTSFPDILLRTAPEPPLLAVIRDIFREVSFSAPFLTSERARLTTSDVGTAHCPQLLHQNLQRFAFSCGYFSMGSENKNVIVSNAILKGGLAVPFSGFSSSRCWEEQG